MEARDAQTFRETIQHHSKSFSFASTLIPGEARRHVEVLYTWCRRADDAIDLADPEDHDAALAALKRELDAIYAGDPSHDALVTAMQQLVREFQIPRTYPEELLEGMAMDARGVAYPDLDTLLLYCYRVAGTVGLMMSHVLGVRDPRALQHAVHLGIAMQITNICRDVREDWDRGRLYLPHDLLARHGAAVLPWQKGRPLSHQCRDALSRSVSELLNLADVYYASADIGMRGLSWRAALAVRAARFIYAAIGDAVRARGCDVFAGRAFVPKCRKYLLGLKAVAWAIAEIPFRTLNRFSRAPLSRPLRYPGDVLLLQNKA
ncbi:MAG: phytoene/squalene synthase family protein [Candidatus Hydrogenedentes bacterium]|nr:phytoene/squalene synthase family protein [Candidatus Hydrogenedentota bacterium]